MAIKYTNSSLVDVTILSPNHYTGRTCGYAGHDEGIYIFTPHCMAYDGTVESCGNVFKNPSRNASSNYGIDSKGRRGLYVEEKNASWCSSNRENDMHAITVEIACDDTHPYKMTDKAIESYIELTVDCMKRNNLNKITYLGSLEATRAYKRADGEALITLHRWFAAKACPGDYFVSKIPYIVSEINKRVKPEPKPQTRLGKLTVIDNSVDVREKPDKSSQIYKIKKKGEVINVVALVGKWYLTINGNFVFNDSRIKYESRKNSTNKLSKLYKEKTTASQVLMKIPKDSKVLNLNDLNDGWSKIWYDNKIGYVKNENLKSSFKLSKYITCVLKKDTWLRNKMTPGTFIYKEKKILKNEKIDFICTYNKKYSQILYKGHVYYILNKDLED